MGAMKVWQHSNDKVLSELSRRIVKRHLFKIEVSKEPFTDERIAEVKSVVAEKLDLEGNEIDHFVYSDKLQNNAYNDTKENINLLLKNRRSCRCIQGFGQPEHFSVIESCREILPELSCLPLFKAETTLYAQGT